MSNAQSDTTSNHEVTIFHNPSCSSSRGALGILDERSIDREVIEYLLAPPARGTLEMIVSKLVDPVTDLIRRSDKQFVAAGFDPDAYQTTEEVIDFLLEYPELMQRPIVIKGDRAIIARPGDRVAELLS